MNQTKTISTGQLAAILGSVKGATFLTISALVDTRARKTGNPFAKVLKLSPKVNGVTGADYEASVNRQLGREGKGQLTFTATEHKWGERIGPALLRHRENGSLYLVIQPQSTGEPLYFGANPGKMLQHVAKEDIAAFLPAERPATNQGTDKEIVYRNYALESIASISIGGQRYRVRHDSHIPKAPKVRAMSKTVGRSFKEPRPMSPYPSDYDSEMGWDAHKLE